MNRNCLGYIVISLAYEHAQNFWDFPVSMETDNNRELSEEMSDNNNIENNENEQTNGYTHETLEDKIRHLDIEKNSLSLQVNVLTEQVEAQGERIREMEYQLEDKRQKIHVTEDMYQNVCSYWFFGVLVHLNVFRVSGGN
ncbi:Protein tyrosine phosphatase [Mactra antiquata]